MQIMTIRNKIVLRAEDGMWITRAGYDIFAKQLVTNEEHLAQWFEITDEEKEAIQAQQNPYPEPGEGD